MAPPNDLAHKGEQVEEWLDLRFFRPLGLMVARGLRATPVTADHVTLAGMAIGLAGAVLFYADSPWWNALGLALLVGSDILDSADGQLARLRGTSSRWGRILDGLSDTVRFTGLYLVLGARLLADGVAPLAVAGLMVAAGASQSIQARVADFMRQVFLWFARAKAELDLPEDLAPADRQSALGRLQLVLYRRYVDGQVAWCPASAALVRRERRSSTAGLADHWTRIQGRWIGRLALIGTNIRFPLLALAIVAGSPLWFLAGNLVLNLPFLWILLGHERQARSLGEPASEPLPAERGWVR